MNRHITQLSSRRTQWSSGIPDSLLEQVEHDIGRFILLWQKLELHLRILSARVNAHQGLYRYHADVSDMVSSVTELGGDASLADRIEALNKSRIVIVHGIILGQMREGPLEAVLFVHQDFAVTPAVPYEVAFPPAPENVSERELKWLEKLAEWKFTLKDMPSILCELAEVSRLVERLLAVPAQQNHPEK